MKRVMAVALLSASITLGGIGTAVSVELFDSDTGWGRAAVHAWSRGYREVGVVAQYSGRGEIRMWVECGNGFERFHSWTDFGPRFRFIQTVPTYTRCNYDVVLTTGGSFIRLGIGGLR